MDVKMKLFTKITFSQGQIYNNNNKADTNKVTF